jgi:MFS family permease
LLALFSINTLLLCADAVLPTYIEDHHPDIGEEKLSIIIAAPEFAALVLAPSIGILLDRYGRKNVSILGFFMLIIGVLGFSYLDFVKNSTAYFYLGILFRFI